ncbi:MAG: ABC-2 family transporter protein [Nitrospirae bacterium]|nr:ABC-2 family transporter protein [Candidatus Manganitrophaceae bacterium]
MKPWVSKVSAQISRYLFLYRSFLAHNLKNEMIYRANFVIAVIMDIFFMGVNVVFFAILYANVETIGGWSFHQTMVLVGSVGVVREIAYLTFRQGFLELGEYIRTGRFDAMLTAPMAANAHLAFRHVSLTESLGEGLMGLALVVYGFIHLPDAALSSIPLYLVMLINSLLLYYAFCLIINSAVFWLVKSQELNTVVYYFIDTARYPREIYRGLGKAFFTFVVPSSLIATVPASILTGRADVGLIALTLCVTAVLLSLGLAIWNWSLQHYSSASS